MAWRRGDGIILVPDLALNGAAFDGSAAPGASSAGVGVVDAPDGVHGDGRVHDAGSPDASELDTDSD